VIFDIDKIKSTLKALGSEKNNEVFLKGFLAAFGFPAATISRLDFSSKANVDKGLSIPNKIFFLSTTAGNVYTEFKILKKNDLSKIKLPYIIIANESELIAYESLTGDILESSKEQLHEYADFFLPLIGRKKSAEMLNKSIDLKATEKMAQLYNELIIKNSIEQSAAINDFMYRFLLLSFTDSIGKLVKSGSLLAMIEKYTDESGKDLGVFFGYLFAAVKKPDRKSMPSYFLEVYVLDERLFEKDISKIAFSKSLRKLIIELLALNWLEITPEIVGALMQQITRPDIINICSNFTSNSNIQKVVGPLFLDALYQEFDSVKDDKEKSKELLNRIIGIRILDPSCGAGNFLLFAYRELKKLAKKILEAIEERPCKIIFPIENFFGIEEDAFSCAMTRLGFFFVLCQEAQRYGELDKIFPEALDALFNKNIVPENATRISWESLCPKGRETYIIGNPQYRGSKKMTASQTADLQLVFAEYDKYSELDYASCWFLLAAKYISKNGGGFAFVATNSLTQGQNAILLWPKLYEQGVKIRFAHKAFKWKNDAKKNTAVTVVIIGMVSTNDSRPCELYSSEVLTETKSISQYLVEGDIAIEKKSKPISDLPEMIKGNMPYGKHLLLSREEMIKEVARDARVAKFLKKIVGSDEFINSIERWIIWIRDEELQEALTIIPIAERIEKMRTDRQSKSDSAARQLALRAHQCREINETTTMSLVIPSVSSESREYFQIGFIDKNTIVTNLAFVIYDCEPWIFGVIASKMHNIWIRTVCGGLETRLRYSSKLGYNTFPFPAISQEQKKAIIDCVYEIIAAREQTSEKTLAQMYKKGSMAKSLAYAHSLLDKVIDSCYREEPFITDQDRINYLYSLYKKMGEKT